MKIVAFADTHGLHESVSIPDGDVLIFAGDLCNAGSITEVSFFTDWFNALPHKTKIFIAGNHDCPLQEQTSLCVGMLNAIYLEDQECDVDGIRIYGSPWTPAFQDWAFMKSRGEEIRAKWDLIPEGLDILVTHGPPFEVLDNTGHDYVGCMDLGRTIRKVKPHFHLFGHCHEDYGSVVRFHREYMNISICDGDYDPCRVPVVFEV